MTALDCPTGRHVALPDDAADVAAALAAECATWCGNGAGPVEPDQPPQFLRPVAGEEPPPPEPHDDEHQAAEVDESPRFLELDEFLALDMPEYDWLVPGLLERTDRVILTGPEGGGKSTLLRQLAVQLASGIHPFGGDPYPALRVLLLDLENSTRQVHRKLRPIRLAAGNAYTGGLMLHVRPQGLDLLDAEDTAWLRALVDATRPQIILTGPVYKLAGGDPTEERTARAVAVELDRLRVLYGCALVLEAHTPYGSNGGKRPERPYGASLWSRWPEFGLYLDPDSGALRHWRGARDERDWPALLQRGGDWPWTVVERTRDVLWARIVEHCMEHGRPSARQLAEALGAAGTTVRRVLDEHSTEWETMA